MLLQDLAQPPTPVTQSTSIVYGLIVVAIGQFAVLVGQWLTARGSRNREGDLARANAETAAALAKASADSIAAAAKLVDDRADRDRKWLVEDRRALAVDLAAKVQATADALAAKQAVDIAAIVQTTKQHADSLATTVKADTTSVASVVDTATKLATGAVSELKEMVTKVGEKADAAYTEANHVNIKIGDLNAALLRVAETTNGKEKP